MSENTLVKKRGRPKKAVPLGDSTTDDVNELPTSVTKRSVQTKRGSAKVVPNIEDVPAKKSRRKATEKTTTSGEASLASPSTSRSTEPVVTEVLTAKQSKLKQVAKNLSDKPPEVPKSNPEFKSSERKPATSATTNLESKRLRSASLRTVEQGSMVHAQRAAPLATTPNLARSSFLSSFLDKDYQEESPIAAEESKISDRSAFKSQNVSINDIIKGEGVSTLPQPSSVSSLQTSEPSIVKTSNTEPTAKPPTFAPLKVHSFPDRSQKSTAVQSKPRLNIPPESFPTSSFMAFKESAALQSRGKSTPVRPPTSINTEFRRANEPQPKPQAASAPKKIEYTKLSYDQIKKLPEYRAKRRFWTTMMVGIPFCLVAGYSLWGRLQAWQERRRVALGVSGPGPRERGVLHSKSPNVGANGGV